MKTLIHPVTGQEFKLGRNKPLAIGPRLSLGNYLLRRFPTPPASADYSQKADGFMRNILGNDVAGNCTIAAAYHVAGMFLANSDQAIPFTAMNALTLYQQLSGWNGVENDASDTGLDELTVLDYWATNGLIPGAHKITAAIKVDGTDAEEVKAAVWLFENCYFAMGLPDAWVSPMPSASGFIWDAAGSEDQDNGHAFMACGFNPQGVVIDTWGMLGIMTWAAVAKYASCYTVLGVDIVEKITQKAPNGFNWTQLVSDIQSMGAAEQ
jgi:hypothetical protein